MLRQFATNFAKTFANLRLGPTLFLFAFALALMNAPANAQGTYLNFKSALEPNANLCMDVSGVAYQSGTPFATAPCTGAPDQTFGYDNGVNLTAGGFCVSADQPDFLGIIIDCDGSDHEAWTLVPFSQSPDVFAIVSPS